MFSDKFILLEMEIFHHFLSRTDVFIAKQLLRSRQCSRGNQFPFLLNKRKCRQEDPAGEWTLQIKQVDLLARKIEMTFV